MGPRTSLPKERPQLTKTNKQTNKQTKPRAKNREKETQDTRKETEKAKQKKTIRGARAPPVEKKTKQTQPNPTEFFSCGPTKRSENKKRRTETKKKQAAKNKKETDRQGVRPRRCVPFLAFHYIFFLCVLVLSFKFAKNLGLAMM